MEVLKDKAKQDFTMVFKPHLIPSSIPGKSSALALLVSLAMTCGVLTGCSQAPVITADKSPRPVQAMELGAERHHYHLSYSAVLAPVQQADLESRVPGPVGEIHVIEGQHVVAGEVLMALDPHDFDVRVAEHHARVREARAAAAQAERDYVRQKAAINDSAMAKVELDRALAKMESSRAQITVAEQHLQMALDAKGYSVITAPYDGVVSRLEVEPFEQVLPGKTVLSIHGDNPDGADGSGGYEVRFDVPSSQAVQLRIGQAGELQLGEQDLPVKVTEIQRTTETRANTHRVIALLQQAPQGAWPELSGRVKLPLPLSRSGYAVPGTAMVGLGKDVHLVRINGDTAEWVDVKPVGFDGPLAMVHGNLNPGDVLVVRGAAYLDDGDRVGQVNLSADASANKHAAHQ